MVAWKTLHTGSVPAKLRALTLQIRDESMSRLGVSTAS